MSSALAMRAGSEAAGLTAILAEAACPEVLLLVSFALRNSCATLWLWWRTELFGRAAAGCVCNPSAAGGRLCAAGSASRCFRESSRYARACSRMAGSSQSALAGAAAGRAANVYISASFVGSSACSGARAQDTRAGRARTAPVDVLKVLHPGPQLGLQRGRRHPRAGVVPFVDPWRETQGKGKGKDS